MIFCEQAKQRKGNEGNAYCNCQSFRTTIEIKKINAITNDKSMIAFKI